MSFLPSQKSLRFLTHHHRHRQTPHHHTHHHRHPRLHTHIHMSQNQLRLPHFLIHRSIPQSPHMFTITHTLHYLYTNRCHHKSEQPDERWLCLFRLFKLIGSGDCSKRTDASDVRRGRGSFTHNRQHSLLPHQSILSPIRTRACLQYLHAKLKLSSSTTSLQNTHARKLKSNCDDNFQGFVRR